MKQNNKFKSASTIHKKCADKQTEIGLSVHEVQVGLKIIKSME